MAEYVESTQLLGGRLCGAAIVVGRGSATGGLRKTTSSEGGGGRNLSVPVRDNKTKKRVLLIVRHAFSV